MTPDAASLDLSVVMPAYDEAGVIGEVVREWDAALSDLRVRYEIRVYDDGSRDATAAIVEDVARTSPAVALVRQANRGHGPTILRGYTEARGAWVLQVDGDGEIAASHVAALWARREADLVLGYRVGRAAPLARRFITAVSAWSVRLLFGGSVRDVNTPYRLFRRDALDRLLRHVPPGVFAPNVILTGLALRAGMRVMEVPVQHRGRRTGTGHLGSIGAWRGAVRALLETARAARAAAGGVS